MTMVKYLYFYSKIIGAFKIDLSIEYSVNRFAKQAFKGKQQVHIHIKADTNKTDTKKTN